MSSRRDLITGVRVHLQAVLSDSLHSPRDPSSIGDY